MTAVKPADVKALLRADFFAFLVRCFAELHGGQKLSPAWHAEVLRSGFRPWAMGGGSGSSSTCRRGI